MAVQCPNGHQSVAEDYCDTCGAPIQQASAATSVVPAGAVTPATTRDCPNCGTTTSVQALFCEECGFDFTTGAQPASGPTSVLEPPAVPEQPAVEPPTWVAEIWVDPDWYDLQDPNAVQPCPSAGQPTVVGLQGRSLLIGRVSQTRNIHPEVDCSGDPGVSRRHAQLTTDGTRWFVEDQQSANGTYVGYGTLPDTPIEPGVKHELAAADRIYLGGWTRIVVRPAAPDEV